MDATCRKSLLIVSALGGFVVLSVLITYITWLTVRPTLDSFFYPKPPPLPSTVVESTEVLLSRLQSVLEKRALKVLTNLQPGLSEAQIAALEAKGGLQLPAEIRAL